MARTWKVASNFWLKLESKHFTEKWRRMKTPVFGARLHPCSQRFMIYFYLTDCEVFFYLTLYVQYDYELLPLMFFYLTNCEVFFTSHVTRYWPKKLYFPQNLWGIFPHILWHIFTSQTVRYFFTSQLLMHFYLTSCVQIFTLQKVSKFLPYKLRLCEVFLRILSQKF